MKRYLLNINTIVFCGVLGLHSVNAAASATQEQIYQFAKGHNIQALSENKNNIDTRNDIGDTAVCQAIKNNDIETYKTLVSVGADTAPECIKNIDKKTYNSFKKNISKNKKAFLGIGKWGWGAIGAGVVAGGAAAAMSGGSGGGGGGSDNTISQDDLIRKEYPYPDKCPDGHIQKGCMQIPTTGEWRCKCDYYCGDNYQAWCQPGYHETGNTCKSGQNILKECVKNTCDGFEHYNWWTCPDGYELGSSCLSGSETMYKCDKKITCPYNTTSCGVGYHETGNTCKSGDTVYKECADDTCEGFTFSNSDSCPAGWAKGASCRSGNTLKYKCDIPAACPYNTISCADGYHETGNTCKSGNVVYKECVQDPRKGATVYGSYNGKILAGNTIVNTDYVDIFGIYHQQNNGVYSNGTNDDALLTITNKNHGNIVGVFNGSNIRVESRTNKMDLNYSGNIQIDNEGNGIIIGLESEDGFNAQANSYCDSYYSDCKQNSSPRTQATGSINISNKGNGDVYGMKAPYNAKAAAESTSSAHAKSSGFINIYNTGDGDVYGLFVPKSQYNHNANAYAISEKGSSGVLGKIYIHSTGNGNIYGIYSFGESTNAASWATGYTARVNAEATIQITSNTTNNIYGLYGDSSVNSSSNNGSGTIIINNIGTGNAFGMFSNNGNALNNIYDKIVLNNFNKNSTVHGIYGMETATSHTGTIYNHGKIVLKSESFVDNDKNYTIPTNHGGNGIGIFSYHGLAENSNSGSISITDLNNAYGIYAHRLCCNSAEASNKGTIEITNAENAYGIYAKDTHYMSEPLAPETTVINSGNIIITDSENAYGIYAEFATQVDNSGTITIGSSSKPITNAYGIYAESGTKVKNSGTITIGSSNNPITNGYGIYAEGNSVIQNTGTISINGASCDGTTCSGSESYGNYIVLNGASLVNGGTMSASAFDFDSMNGNVVATNGAQFIAENDISGTLNLSSDIVADGFNTTYVAENMIQAGDTSKLNLRSGSAMFDAKLADNGNDVVMTMKSFDTLTDNKSLATYLADNYAKETSAEFFGGLKSGANMTEFNNILNGLSGMNAFTQFDREDMSAMREINFSMNQQMFMNNDRDEYQVSGSMEHFSFSNSSNGGSGSYGISNSRMSDNWKLGYGLAMANIGTNDDLGTSRSNQIGLFYMPMTYTNDNIEFISTPRVGFAKSHYSRRGYNNMNYDGYIEKQIFGFNNDLRYPMMFGNWTIAPDLGFNAIMYRQSGHESDQAFSLIIPADEIYSVEAGFGLFTKYERDLSSGGSLRFNSGVMLYRELADTYNMKLGIRGLDGTFNLYDDAEHDYSGAATFGFDYTSGRFSLYSNAQYFVDSDHYINLKGGISYRF